MMTPRERVRAVLSHQEPDRVPLDLGGINTSLMLETHDNLKRKLDLDKTPTQLLSKTWQIAKTDEAILERLAVDIRYIFPEVRFAGESASVNTTNYDIVANNRYGPIIDITAGGQPAVSGDSAASTVATTDPWANFSY